jgi:hypothetical protein
MLAQTHPSAAELADLSTLDRLASRRLGPSRAARAGARVLGSHLDVRLAAGEDPGVSTLLAARASSLTSRPGRRRLATAVETVLDTAYSRPRRWWSVPPENPICANEETLLGLVSLLESDRPLYVRGVAGLWALLGDGTGPLYRRHAGALALALRDVRERMTGAQRGA